MGGEASVLGWSPLDDGIVVEASLTTEDLGTSIVESIRTTAERLLWAWGCTDDALLRYVVEDAQMEHYGRDQCPNDRLSKPVNYDTCLQCREQKRSV